MTSLVLADLTLLVFYNFGERAQLSKDLQKNLTLIPAEKFNPGRNVGFSPSRGVSVP